MLFTPWSAMISALKTKASIYHYHDPELLPMGFVLRWVFGKKVVFDVHESVPRQIMSKPYLPRFTRRAISFCYKLIERVFITGQTMIVANKNSVSDYSSHTYLVQNYPLADEQMVAAASDGKQRNGIPLLVYVGRVSRIRGAVVCIELAAGLARRGHDFRVQLIGPYSETFGTELKAKIEELHLQDKVTLTGHMDWPEAMKLTSQAAIGLCLLLPEPNYTACLATKIIEYMMVGTPVLASDFDVWRPYVEGESTGMMANPTSIDDVVNVCEQMLGNPDELANMGRRGMEAVRTRYNWNREFEVLLECYENLLRK